MRTSKLEVYAAGDVTGRDQFVYMAAYGARIAAQNAHNGDSNRYDATAMPAVVFTDPQVASVGLTQTAALKRRTAPESGLTRPPSAMQRRHRDDSRWAFPLAAPHSDIVSEEALASRPKKAELHVEIRGRIGRPPALGGTLGPCHGTHSICCSCSHCQQSTSVAVPIGRGDGPHQVLTGDAWARLPKSDYAAEPSRKWESEMFASESCSKVGCFLEAALPVIAPAVALVSMLSIAAFCCSTM
jgi:hypothetical protein